MVKLKITVTAATMAHLFPAPLKDTGPPGSPTEPRHTNLALGIGREFAFVWASLFRGAGQAVLVHDEQRERHVGATTVVARAELLGQVRGRMHRDRRTDQDLRVPGVLRDAAVQRVQLGPAAAAADRRRRSHCVLPVLALPDSGRTAGRTHRRRRRMIGGEPLSPLSFCFVFISVYYPNPTCLEHVKPAK